MLVQPITNLNSYNKYKSTPCSTARSYNKSPVSNIYSPINISFKGMGNEKLYKIVRGPYLDFAQFKEACDNAEYLNALFCIDDNCDLRIMAILIKDCEKTPAKYRAIEYMLNHSQFRPETLEDNDYPITASVKDVACQYDKRAYEMICDYQDKRAKKAKYDSFKEQMKAEEDSLEKRKQALATAETAIKEREAKLEGIIQARTDEIYKQARIDAQKEIKKQKADLAKQQKKLEQEKQTLDNMIKTYESLHADDLRYDRETLASGLMSVYGINPPEKLPENLNFGEQVVFVMNVLVPRQNKLTDINDDTPETITKAIQDDSEKISNEGLKFLERIIDLSKDECNENDLISAIKSVKGNYGSFDMGKVSLFIRTLSWGNNTIQSSIKKVQKLAV